MIEWARLDLGAIALGAVVGGGLGAAWSSPALFGNAWLSEIGRTADERRP